MSSSSAPTNLIGAKLGNYRIERLLGRGRMGMVYLARDEALLRPIAVKLLAWALPDAQNHDPQAWLLAEARNIARVSHPAVIQVYGVAKHGPYAYIAMEYVDGVSADRAVAERGPFGPAAATEILLQIAGALQAAHEGAVIHRDIKPANILIRADGSAKLGDFGMAIHRQNPSTVVTGHGQVGTPLYTAPEIWGGGEATPATDLYALGATYHQLLTGYPPFEAGDLPALIEAHRQQEPPRLASLVGRVPAACIEILRCCLAKSPVERVASAQSLAWMARGALRAIERGSSEPRRTSSARLRVARDGNLELLGLSRAPFADFSDAQGLEPFEPFTSAAAELRANLQTKGASVLLMGQAGSGRSSLLREILTPAFWAGPKAWVDVDAASPNGSLQQRACRAFGALPSSLVSKHGAIEGLLEYLASASSQAAGPGLLVVEASVPLRAHLRDLEALSSAASTTGYFSLLVVGGIDAGRALPDSTIVSLPTFARLQLLDYLRGRLARCRARGAAPCLVTPDAALLLYAHSDGSLAKVNRFATRMLEIAAAQKSRVLTSSHARAAIDAADGPADGGVAELLTSLNAERAAAGLPPREPHVPIVTVLEGTA